MTKPEHLLLKLNTNLNTLQERAAKYGDHIPLELRNQISDHHQALALTEQYRQGQLSVAEWQQALEPLLIAIQVRTGEAVAQVQLEGVVAQLQELLDKLETILASGQLKPLVSRVMSVLEQVVSDQSREIPATALPLARNLSELVLAQIGLVEPRIARKYPENPAGYQDPLRDALRELLADDRGLVARLELLLARYEAAAKNHTPETGYRATVTGSGAVAQGPGAVAAGAGGIAISGNVSGNISLSSRPGRNASEEEERDS